jgi:hypothetical protein
MEPCAFIRLRSMLDAPGYVVASERERELDESIEIGAV